MYTPQCEALTNAHNNGVSPYKCQSYFTELPVSNISKNTAYITSKQAYDGTLNHNMAAAIVVLYCHLTVLNLTSDMFGKPLFQNILE